MLSLQTAGYALLLALPLVYIFRRRLASTAVDTAVKTADSKDAPSIMQAPVDNLAPPKDDPYTLEQLKAYDGSDPSKPIYVAIKGTIFDVSRKADVYGPGKSYNIFAGKDGSKGLGMSSLKDEHAVPDWRDLPDSEKKVLNDWHEFFKKRYNIVGRVSDLSSPVATANL